VEGQRIGKGALRNYVYVSRRKIEVYGSQIDEPSSQQPDKQNSDHRNIERIRDYLRSKNLIGPPDAFGWRLNQIYGGS
jgi:hypothetical protein